MNSRADFYFRKNEKWSQEITMLREIILSCGLNEEPKWGCPCYTLDDKNIVLIHVFKEYCAVLFFKGALLKDDKGILVQQTANVQAARQMRFTNTAEVRKYKSALIAYIRETIKNEKSGLKVPLKKTAEFEMPVELQERFGSDPALKMAFKGLTPGRQRGYLLYFSSAKQSKTREARIDKYAEHILNGKGIDD